MLKAEKAVKRAEAARERAAHRQQESSRAMSRVLNAADATENAIWRAESAASDALLDLFAADTDLAEAQRDEMDAENVWLRLQLNAAVESQARAVEYAQDCLKAAKCSSALAERAVSECKEKRAEGEGG